MSHPENPPPHRYWACPVNVNGLDHGSVTTLIEADLFDLLRPTLGAGNDPESVFQLQRKVGPIDYGDLHDVVESRIATLTKFLRQVRLSIDTRLGMGECVAPVKIRALSSDTHNGGKRPLIVEFAEGPWVLKFSDPRPHQLLSAILDEVSVGIGTDLQPPRVVADHDQQWYFMPYIEPSSSDGQGVENFMFALGALTAVAYCLAMTDLHLENLVVFQGKPVTIDAECILYNFPPEGERDRLLSTGLLSRNPRFSALRGGDPSSGDFIQIGLRERTDGGLDYIKPAGSFHNRFRNSDGTLADPSEHRRSLFGGFRAAFGWFVTHKHLTFDIIEHFVPDDFRIRFLVRTTRLYTTAIHMLNLPSKFNYDGRRGDILSQLHKAGHFLKELSEDVVTAEKVDLVARDIPFFWVNAGEGVIRHHTGPKQWLPSRWNARKQAIADIRALSRTDIDVQAKVLSDFLDADLHASN
ncbi:MAG: DUF4135 domain-containing protein [Alphaproteobacteria bacterium]|nr:DUF4135 domain-containing protein [Alphaproteobacteria bacterium]